VSQVTSGEKELNKLTGKVTQLQTQVAQLERNETVLSSQISQIISRPSLDIPAASEALTSSQLQTTEG
jgi:phage shock protein A